MSEGHRRDCRLALVGSLSIGGWVRVCAAALLVAPFGLAARDEIAHASSAAQSSASSQTARAANAVHEPETVEPRRQPMTFTWHPAPNGACAQDCRDLLEAVGVIASAPPAARCSMRWRVA